MELGGLWVPQTLAVCLCQSECVYVCVCVAACDRNTGNNSLGFLSSSGSSGGVEGVRGVAEGVGNFLVRDQRQQ